MEEIDLVTPTPDEFMGSITNILGLLYMCWGKCSNPGGYVELNWHQTTTKYNITQTGWKIVDQWSTTTALDQYLGVKIIKNNF